MFYHPSCSSRLRIKKGEEEKKKEKKTKHVIDNTGRHKPFGYVAWEPVDDVHMLRFYPKPSHDVGTAVDMLKEFQRLEFSPPDQIMTIDLRLDMKLEKKVQWCLFVFMDHDVKLSRYNLLVAFCMMVALYVVEKVTLNK